MSEWQQVSLGDYVDHQKGYIFKSKDYQSEGELIVRVSDFTDRSVDISSCNRISKSKAIERESVKLNAFDVVIATVGSWPKNPASIVGKTICVPKEAQGGLLNQNAVRLRAINGMDQRFLFYLLKTKGFQNYIVSTAQGSANQASITLRDIFRFTFDIPSLPEQKSIAHTLGSLDDKIELNRQINETLEAMAQALFKSWFVDFDPVIDNALAAGNAIPDVFAERAKQRAAAKKSENQSTSATAVNDSSNYQHLFPAEFEFTEEMGWIPLGWGISTLGGESDFLNGYAFKSKELTKEPKDSFHVLKMGHIKRGGGFNYDGTKSYIPTENAEDVRKYFLLRGDVLMAMTDMKSSMALLGHTALMSVDNEFLLNQRVGRLRPKKSGILNYSYIYIFTNLESTIEEIRSRANSGVQVNLSTTEIKRTAILVPTKSIHDSFDMTASSLFDRLFQNDSQIRALSKLRDTLLPKLLSGELRIPDAEKLVQEALL